MSLAWPARFKGMASSVRRYFPLGFCVLGVTPGACNGVQDCGGFAFCSVALIFFMYGDPSSYYPKILTLGRRDGGSPRPQYCSDQGRIKPHPYQASVPDYGSLIIVMHGMRNEYKKSRLKIDHFYNQVKVNLAIFRQKPGLARK